MRRRLGFSALGPFARNLMLWLVAYDWRDADDFDPPFALAALIHGIK